MGLLLAEIAERITCTACAVATTKVNVVTFEPFTVTPNNLLNKTFEDVAIKDDQTVAIMKKAAAELVPVDQKGRDQIQANILAQAVDTTKKIVLFADFI